MIIEYEPGGTNQVADVLSRKAELAALKIEKLEATSQLKAALPNRIKEGLEKDHFAKGLLELVQ